jgi:hypothetical protein
MDTITPDAPQRGNIFARSFGLIREHWRAWLIANLVYYGVLIAGLVIIAFNRDLQQLLYDAIGKTFSGGGPLAAIGEAYTTGQVFRAIGLTFVVNLAIGTLVSITLPSLVIPFSGWLIAFYRALLWGFIFSPAPGSALSGLGILSGVLIVGLLVLEGEGYVLGALAAWLQGRAVLAHKRLGYGTLGQGYLTGLRQTALMYVAIVIVLLVAAIYEVAISFVVA